MDINRKTAYLVLMDVERKDAYSNLALNHHIAIRKPSNEAFVRRLTYGVLEDKRLLDYTIDQLIPGKVSKVRLPELTILRMGIYQLARMCSVPEYAAVNESVNLAKKYARGKEKFVNGVLRSYVAKKMTIKLPSRYEDEVRYLSIKYSYAPWIIRLWMETYDMESLEALLKAGNEAPDTVIRLNWMKIMKKDLMDYFRSRGYEVEEGQYSQNAIHIKGAKKRIIDNEMYDRGYYSIQDEASQLAVQMLEPQKGETVMDVCAAPGGKTMAMAERMNNLGTIIASDVYRRKVDIIEREARRLGITNVKTRTWDATRVDPEMVGKADRVLVDAPCSGLGVIRRKPEIKYKEYTDALDALPRKQLIILSAASHYVKSGGYLMYSTCTINPYENERVVSDFLRKHVNFELVERKQLLPSRDGTDGFFICKMKMVR